MVAHQGERAEAEAAAEKAQLVGEGRPAPPAVAPVTGEAAVPRKVEGLPASEAGLEPWIRVTGRTAAEAEGGAEVADATVAEVAVVTDP